MNLSKQIKKLREGAGYSQEELSEKIYVSRQTISNWENERSYPDIHNLLLLSVLFNVTLDELVKGDVETMKKVIKKDEMNKYSWIMAGTIMAAAILFGPAWKFLGNKGLLIPFILWAIGMWAAIKIEKIKKEKNVKTYKEIVAYMEDEDVDIQRKERSFGKDLLSKTLIVVTFTAVVTAIVLVSLWVSGMF
ncbi:helix-turn-helix domain-containing protein [Candidatus Enterococcus murrayae]|uniref:Helix-turn-helix transcriptional regulator n=1 Tax=Candidatus Enterococcus murrayae TaxID=2815321 RepID=A0ABS3HN13_9ENTE|nr:helix-turn-helix transcriptional regulator [Enterococcus sp. MJM16]MBO0454854.1 helix-turn-helix transcriptional regulator [Enterococcus sp. MJM16]